MLNALRGVGMKKGKAAKTGAQPGVTRKIGSAVKIVERSSSTEKSGEVIVSEGIYVLDTPGVFMPYVPHAESMLKLALCGAVKDTIIAPVTLADYLLFRLNLHDPQLYTEYMPDGQPTNDVSHLLMAVAQKIGRLGRGGEPDVDGAALWLIQRWRSGVLGRFMLDEVDKISLTKDQEGGAGVSINQARKHDREVRRERMVERGRAMKGI